MTGDESRFHDTADKTLRHIAEVVEDVLGDELDVDMQGGILTIELSDRRQYVLNKHTPNRELWLSSPVSGAWHFAWDEGLAWRSTRDPAVALKPLLAGELETLTGTPVEL